MSQAMLLYAHLTDKELLKTMQQPGRALCFEVLVRRHSNALYRIARVYELNTCDAGELIRCAHVEAFRRISEFPQRLSFRTWLSRLMITHCLKVRKNDPNEGLISEPACGRVPAALPADSVRVEKTDEVEGKAENRVEALPLPVRTAYVLAEIDGYSISETAYLLSTTEEHIRTRLLKARTLLKRTHRDVQDFPGVYQLSSDRIDRIVSEVLRGIEVEPGQPAGVPTA